MLKRERQAYILHQVNLHNKVLSTDLSQHINVSDDTIRRDLQELAEAGKLIKVHGGALSPGLAAEPDDLSHARVWPREPAPRGRRLAGAQSHHLDRRFPADACQA